MRKLIFAALVIVIFSSMRCDDDKKLSTNACTPDVSIDNVPWLVELKNSMTNCTCEISIIRGTYEGQDVIFIGITDPACNGIDTPTLYSCEGNEIRTFTDSPADQQELHAKLTRDNVLYRCKD